MDAKKRGKEKNNKIIIKNTNKKFTHFTTCP